MVLLGVSRNHSSSLHIITTFSNWKVCQIVVSWPCQEVFSAPSSSTSSTTTLTTTNIILFSNTWKKFDRLKVIFSAVSMTWNIVVPWSSSFFKYYTFTTWKIFVTWSCLVFCQTSSFLLLLLLPGRLLSHSSVWRSLKLLLFLYYYYNLYYLEDCCLIVLLGGLLSSFFSSNTFTTSITWKIVVSWFCLEVCSTLPWFSFSQVSVSTSPWLRFFCSSPSHSTWL